MNEPKIISQKTVLKTKLFNVKDLKIVLSTGSKKTHTIAERNSTISVFPLTDSYEIYLVSQYRYLLGKTSLEAVAGFIDKGETSLAAAKRELKEETGILANQWEELARIEMAASVFKGTAHLFLAKGLEIETARPEEGENITLVKMPLKRAVEKAMNGEINVSASIIGILLLDKLHKEKKR